MSWNARLTDDRGHDEGTWNYTHNCNCMANVVLADAGYVAGIGWWQRLNGKSGPEGAAFLHDIIRVLDSDPERFKAMNPENGWGDYGSFMSILTDMRDAVPEWPTTWSVDG